MYCFYFNFTEVIFNFYCEIIFRFENLKEFVIQKMSPWDKGEKIKLCLLTSIF